jgi:hypothetical protein
MKTKKNNQKKSLKKLQLNKRTVSKLLGGFTGFKTSTAPTCSISTPAYCWKN